MARKQNTNSQLEKGIKLIQDQSAELLKLAGVYDSMYNSISKINEGLGSTASIQNKLNKGQNASKQIDDGLMKNKAKMQALAMKMKTMKKHGLKFDMEEARNARKKLQVEKDILLQQKDQQNSLEHQGKVLKENLKGFMKSKYLAGGITAMMTSGVYELDKLWKGYNKTYGFTSDIAKSVHERTEQLALASQRVSITFKTLHKTMAGIATSTGLYAGTLRSDVLEEASELSKLMGISNKGMSNLALNAQRTGQNMEAQSISMVKGIRNAENMVGATVDMEVAFKAASETTGLIRANIGRSYEEIARVTAQAQAFGLTLQDLASISSNMLNFQSSIEAELTAELFIGKQLNLEKARLYALTGDYESLQKEIVGQLGSEYEFLRMNTLQKQKYAAALGMSVNQMSDLVLRNAELSDIEQQARDAGDEQTLNMLKQRDLQQQIADFTEKLQTTFISLAKGPLGKVAEVMAKVLSSTEAVYGILGLMAVMKMGSIIASLKMVSKFLSLSALRAGFTMAAMTAGIGLIAAVGAAAIFAAAMKGAESRATAGGDTTAASVKSYQGLGDEEMVTLDRGAALFHSGESVVRSENFGRMNAILERIDSSINKQKLNINVESHHGTRFR
mgnify:CR=1 FL=1